MPTCSAIAPSTGRRCRSKPQSGFETCRRHRAHENGIVNAQCTAQTQRGTQCRFHARPGYNTCLRHATAEQQPPRVAAGFERGGAPSVELTIQQVRDMCFLAAEGFSTADILAALGLAGPPPRAPQFVAEETPRARRRRRTAARNNADTVNDRNLKPHHIDIITRALCDAPAGTTTTCAVCISDYPDMVAPVETDCGHVFCKACITDWACTHKHNSCPACRKELV